MLAFFMPQAPVSAGEKAGLCLGVCSLGLVLYFFGLGPVAYASMHMEVPARFLELYYAPLAWMPESGLVSRLIGSYIELWVGHQC